MCDMPAASVDYALRYTTKITSDSFGNWNFTNALKALKAPLLVIYGDQDPSPISSQRAWADTVPDGRLLIFAGAGHNPQSDRPQQAFEAIKTFIAGQWPAGAIENPR
jgi:pimeloyl-ACP methyl ester carboxylesterase